MAFVSTGTAMPTGNPFIFDMNANGSNISEYLDNILVNPNYTTVGGNNFSPLAANTFFVGEGGANFLRSSAQLKRTESGGQPSRRQLRAEHS
jgi:hypothetical protein